MNTNALTPQELNELEKRVPLVEAMNSITLYKQKMAHLFGADFQPVRGFAVLHADLIQLLGITDATALTHQHFRCYIGMEEIEGSSFGGFRFFLVPMKANMFEDGSDDIQFGDLIVDGVIIQGQYVYDFNTPCPKTCDTTSDLYLAGDNA